MSLETSSTRRLDRGLTSQKGRASAIRFTYRRWLGFLKTNYPDDLSMPPAERITPERVRAFIEHLSAEMRPTLGRHRCRPPLRRRASDSPAG